MSSKPSVSYKPSVAVLGTSGFLGEPVLAAFSRPDLVDKIQFPVKALTTNIRQKRDNSTVQFVEGSITLANKQAIIEELAGTDVIIELLPADLGIFRVVEEIVKEIQPKVVKSDHSTKIREFGVKVVDIYTSLFAIPESALYEVVGQVGINKEENTATLYGPPQTKVAISFLPDIGNAVASLASIEPLKLPNSIRIQSDEVSYADIIIRYEVDHNIKLKVNQIDGQQALKSAQEKYSKLKTFGPGDFFFYLTLFGGLGTDNGLSYSSNDDELVNPNGQLWSWSKFNN
ncbi:hypothetical protein QCA50_018341 [Cerrena zonata]|uniref:NmrA-like domain-containing protein n=1 Tax=Cerrena zonata TaxID=2478898 RepID=A0AAW0FM04_9APHY